MAYLEHLEEWVLLEKRYDNLSHLILYFGSELASGDIVVKVNRQP